MKANEFINEAPIGQSIKNFFSSGTTKPEKPPQEGDKAYTSSVASFYKYIRDFENNYNKTLAARSANEPDLNPDKIYSDFKQEFSKFLTTKGAGFILPNDINNVILKDLPVTVTGKSEPNKTTEPEPSEIPLSLSLKKRAPSATSTPSATPKSAGQNSSIEPYLQKWAADIRNVPSTRPQDKIALAREMINFLRDRRGSPETARATTQARAVLQRDPNIPAAQKAQILSALPKMESKLYNFINQILESVGITWKQIGVAIINENNNYYVIPQNKLYLLEAGIIDKLKSKFAPKQAPEANLDNSNEYFVIDNFGYIRKRNGVWNITISAIELEKIADNLTKTFYRNRKLAYTDKETWTKLSGQSPTQSNPTQKTTGGYSDGRQQLLKQVVGVEPQSPEFAQTLSNIVADPPSLEKLKDNLRKLIPPVVKK